MATTKGQGTLLKLSIASVFTTISQRTSIKPPKKTRNKIETTDLDSTAETSIPGIPRSGECEFTLNYDPIQATHAALETSFTNGVVESWKLIYADPGVAEDAFSGWISEFGREEATTDGLMKCTIKIQITDVVTLTP